MKEKKTAAAGICVGLFLCLQLGTAAGQARISSAQLGLGITPQFDIVNPTTEFSPDTPKIYCAWKAEGSSPERRFEAFGLLKMWEKPHTRILKLTKPLLNLQ